jgi:hypothetical protein
MICHVDLEGENVDQYLSTGQLTLHKVSLTSPHPELKLPKTKPPRSVSDPCSFQSGRFHHERPNKHARHFHRRIVVVADAPQFL